MQSGVSTTLALCGLQQGRMGGADLDQAHGVTSARAVTCNLEASVNMEHCGDGNGGLSELPA